MERRRNAEHGVKWVRCREGRAIWQEIDSGRATADAVYDIIPTSKPNIRANDGAVLFQFEYTGGFRGALFMLSSASRTGVAVKLKGEKLLNALTSRVDVLQCNYAWRSVRRNLR
ncbi:MAG: hypothetical protein KDA99_09805 [Planctomycetales bacterium]|nr:hypothetical protein [Planctomycetales bacterium]